MADKKEPKKQKYEPPRVRSISERQLFASGQSADTTADQWNWPTYTVAQCWPAASLGYAQYPDGGTRYNPDGSRIPICHITDEDQQLVVAVELPGVEREEIKVELTPADVVVAATSAKEAVDLRFYGVLSFSEEVNVEESKARLENGLLTLVLAKVGGAQEYTLEIE